MTTQNRSNPIIIFIMLLLAFLFATAIFNSLKAQTTPPAPLVGVMYIVASDTDTILCKQIRWYPAERARRISIAAYIRTGNAYYQNYGGMNIDAKPGEIFALALIRRVALTSAQRKMAVVID